jgi:hypothetical protein
MLRTMATSQSDRPPQFPVRRALDLLGYPADAKLLIIHADDLGMCHSVNAAIFKALDEQTISSASAMVPCPGFGEAAEYAKRNPGRDLGIHLTLTSEWEKYRWGPVLGSQSCASLIDESGYFFGSTKNGKREIGEVRKELSAQVEQAVRAGLAPSHLDSHMLFPLENRDLAKAYIELGRHYEVPFLMRPPELAVDKNDDVFHVGRPESGSPIEEAATPVVPSVAQDRIHQRLGHNFGSLFLRLET